MGAFIAACLAQRAATYRIDQACLMHTFSANNLDEAVGYIHRWIREQKPESDGWVGHWIDVYELDYEMLQELMSVARRKEEIGCKSLTTTE